MSDVNVKGQIPANARVGENTVVDDKPSRNNVNLPLEKHLYESLQRKQRLFKILELEGYVQKTDAATIEKQINKALVDLEEIIEKTA